MIGEPVVIITCDDCGENWMEKNLTATARGWDDRDLADEIEASGWKVDPGNINVHICPDCQAIDASPSLCEGSGVYSPVCIVPPTDREPGRVYMPYILCGCGFMINVSTEEKSVLMPKHYDVATSCSESGAGHE